ncbi:MAG: hypothetical protein LBT02_01580 [Rickettsiales bacterium]|jgi:hypothetical protein|nr:hypothetical protein [Rickettsiales bacterium]
MKFLIKIKNVFLYIKNREYKITDILIFLIAGSVISSIFFNLKITLRNGEVNRVIAELNEINIAIKNFEIKYDALPGDTKKTQIFTLSKKNTDGNENGIIEDKNQMDGVEDENLKFDGEVYNFFIHLYNSGFLKNSQKVIFPINKFLNAGILVFNRNNKNYFHLGIKKIRNDKDIEIYNNLTPHIAYMFDNKIDDGNPFDGDVQVYGGNHINKNSKVNEMCADKEEYFTFYKFKVCQIIIKVKGFNE